MEKVKRKMGDGGLLKLGLKLFWLEVREKMALVKELQFELPQHA
jgi:hypothetical protein